MAISTFVRKLKRLCGLPSPQSMVTQCLFMHCFFFSPLLSQVTTTAQISQADGGKVANTAYALEITSKATHETMGYLHLHTRQGHPFTCLFLHEF